MADFYTQSNNGVYAVVTEAVYRKLEERSDLLAECQKMNIARPQLPPIRPIFTFSRPNHPSFKFMTGSLDCMEKLLRGHSVKRGGIWVPFSNGAEHRLGSAYESDREEANWELLACTSLDEAIEAFGLIPGGLPVSELDR